MKIAVASSGLGHVARGIETWARDTAVALSQFSIEGGVFREDDPGHVSQPADGPVKVTLFCAAPLPGLASEAQHLDVRVLPCLKRGDWLTRLLVRAAPGFTWRWGWKSGYDMEQRSFWRHLWPVLRDEQFDILHVQDPLLADLCRRYRACGKLKTKEILAHGTEESAQFLARFPYVQHLAPWHLEETIKALR